MLGGLVAGRAFVGFGVAAANVVSVNVISDIFCRDYSFLLSLRAVAHNHSTVHERGTFIGLVTVALINGPHVASLRAHKTPLDPLEIKC
jgi:MFS family permease